jgi:hypothetical protein
MTSYFLPFGNQLPSNIANTTQSGNASLKNAWHFLTVFKLVKRISSKNIGSILIF